MQNAVNGVVKEQKQPAVQGWVELQLPPQVAEPFASLRNCRAETVPAQRTAVTIVENNTVFIVLCMQLSFLTTLNYCPGARESWGFPEQNPVPFETKLQKQRSEHP